MEKITHQGIITAVERKSVKAKIISRSACSQCQAHKYCTLNEQKEKIISVIVPENHTFKIGDDVVISLPVSAGMEAVAFGYILPLILLVITIVSAHYCGCNDFISGISGIIILIPYYFGLFLFRRKLKSLFEFEIKHLD